MGRPKSYLASILAMSAMFESSPNRYLNDDILFPRVKPIRNVPQYMPKNEQPRNEQCKCSSGLKYKKCCGKA
jgi:uncharacterized protein YchJ